MSKAERRNVSFVHRIGLRPLFVPPDLDDQVEVRGDVNVSVVAVNEAWIQVAIDDLWVAAYRMTQQNGFPVIAEVRVYPKETGRQAGEWSGTFITHPTVPLHGITATILRRLRPGDTVGSDIRVGREAWQRYIGLFSPKAGANFEKQGYKQLKRPRTSSGGRRRWTENDLLRAAVFYVEARGRRPVFDLAMAWKIPHSHARDVLQAAREKDLLTPGRQGVRSRTLTDKARRLLAAETKPDKLR